MLCFDLFAWLFCLFGGIGCLWVLGCYVFLVVSWVLCLCLNFANLFVLEFTVFCCGCTFGGLECIFVFCDDFWVLGVFCYWLFVRCFIALIDWYLLLMVVLVVSFCLAVVCGYGWDWLILLVDLGAVDLFVRLLVLGFGLTCDLCCA